MGEGALPLVQLSISSDQKHPRGCCEDQITVAGKVLKNQKGILVWALPFYGFVLCRGPTKKKKNSVVKPKIWFCNGPD